MAHQTIRSTSISQEQVACPGRRGALPVDDSSAGPAERAIDGEDHAMITAAFQALPERRQTLLWHAVIENKPPARSPPRSVPPRATSR